jgi:1-acyl-sn-glycerol-3-phosphate acyltransferase
MQTPAPRVLTRRWRFVAGIILGVFQLARWRTDVRGLEHVPTVGGAVIAFNHHSYADFVMVGWPIVRRLRRPLRFIGKKEVCASRWIGWATRWGDVIPVDRSSPAARAGAFSEAEEALRAGDLVAVAPEQTISPSFELLPFRTGVARMAQRTGVPIVAAVGWGSQRFYTKGGRIGRLTRVPTVVSFLPPVHVGPDEDVTEATRALRSRMEAALHDLQEHYVDGAPAGAPWVPARLGGGAPDHATILAGHVRRTRTWGERLDGHDDVPDERA